jgi:hypothetical protein
MADTKALEALNREITELVGELAAMQAKQERLKELRRQRAELEQELLGQAVEAETRGPGRRRANGVQPAAAASE